MTFIIELLVTAFCMYFGAHFIPGIHVNSFGSAFIAAILFALINATLGLILRILTFPLNFLTLGLTSFIIGVLMIYLAGRLLNGFRVDNFTSALFLAAVLAIIKMLFR